MHKFDNVLSLEDIRHDFVAENMSAGIVLPARAQQLPRANLMPASINRGFPSDTMFGCVR